MTGGTVAILPLPHFGRHHLINFFYSSIPLADLVLCAECIFRHVGRKGFFVVRCDFCESGFFTEPPLLYNRALKHFQKHGEAILDGEELTNEFIFKKFAFQGTSDPQPYDKPCLIIFGSGWR